MRMQAVGAVLVLGLVGVVSRAEAHFPWLAVEGGQVVYFFGEDPSDRTYKLPPSIAKAEVSVVTPDGQVRPLPLEPVESEAVVGLRADAAPADGACLVSQVTFGVYAGSKLVYHTQSACGPLPTSRPKDSAVGKRLDLRAELVDTDGGVDVFVLWKDKPLAGATVKLYCAEGHVEGEAETDADGKVSFTDRQVEEGLNGIMVGHTVDLADAPAGEPASAKHYLTATFTDPQGGQAAAK